MRVCRLINGVEAHRRSVAGVAAAAWRRPCMSLARDGGGKAAGVCSARPVTCKARAAPVPVPRLVLGIETSCDDTGAAVVTSDGCVLGEGIAHQAEIHAAWGGVVPNLAMEAHKEAIDRVVAQALQRAGVREDQLDAVAVTIGPGLSLCLKVGITKARQIARQHRLPMVHVHHMEGHALVARLPPAAAAAAAPALDCTPGLSSSSSSSQEASDPSSTSSSTARPVGPEGAGAGDGAVDGAAAVQFPFLCLLVSGGHNLLLLVQGVGQYMQLGTTLDDALGEAYDKVARMLGLELKPNGGAALEALARQGDPQAFKFAVPMRQHASCDFSYAGLKTSVRLAIEQTTRQHQQQQQEQQQEQQGEEQGAGADAGPSAAALPLQVKADVAASFQRVACVHLTDRVKRGIQWSKELLPDLSELVVAGGVASNQYIRAELAQLAASQGLSLVMPPPRWCTDNGVMIAWAGIERMRLGLVEPPPPPLQPTAPRTDDAATREFHAPDGAGSQGAAPLPPASTGASPADAATPSAGASGASEPGGAEAQEWIDIKARWPLTTEYHPRREAAPWNARKARMHTSLTELTAAAVATAAGGGSPALEITASGS